MKRVCILMLILFVVGCGTTDAEYKYNNNVELGCIITHLQNNNLIVKRPRALYTGTVKAQDGIVIPIGMRNIEVGFFKFNTKVKKQLKHLKIIKESKAIYIQGIKFAAILNGSFVLFDYENHPNKDEIVKAFNSFDLEAVKQINFSINRKVK